MSFGLEHNPGNQSRLKPVFRNIEEEIESARSKIFFAAAGNSGSHKKATFPANIGEVICMHASDGKGKNGRINPEACETDHNFMTLGMGIEIQIKGVQTRKSGTSYAAPIAASMAANILHISEYLNLPRNVLDDLSTGKGMKKMFDLMCEKKDSDGYRFAAPWVKLWKPNWHKSKDTPISIRLEIQKMLDSEYS